MKDGKKTHSFRKSLLKLRVLVSFRGKKDNVNVKETFLTSVTARPLLSYGTDIIKKQLETNDHEYDFSHIKPSQNHAPHRSKSMQDGRHELSDGGMLPGGLPNMDYNRSNNPSSYLNTPYSNNPGNQQEVMQSLNVNTHNRSPSLKVRRYSFLAGSRRGRGFSEIFNSTILNDHFDQYTAPHEDSGFGREIYVTADERLRNAAHPSDTSPDSGVSDTMEDGGNSKRPLQRRRTLPCIVNQQDSKAKQAVTEKETAHSSENLTGKAAETYIIENGIRKRVRAEVHKIPAADKDRGGGGGAGGGGEVLFKQYKIESQKKLSESDKHGSLPDLKHVAIPPKPISRIEAHRLAEARRNELRHLQDMAERRRQGDVAVILGDVKDWCQQRQLLVLVIALNLSLATMFFNLLS